MPSTDVNEGDEDYYRTLYNQELDFRILGKRDGELGGLLKGESHLDFADPPAVMQLTKTLLKLDFGMRVELPPDRLCPPVPNRHNYILWLKNLVDSSAPSYAQAYEPERQVMGLDIGTGASLIYPLLGCAQRPAWSFIATDVDARSLAYARRNVELNNLQSRVRVISRDITAPLVPLDELNVEVIDFVMVNPPFYTSEAELVDLAQRKSRPPNGACTGAPVEMVCEGGEIGFVRRIIYESLILRTRVQWYTSMLGKQSSLNVLIGILKENGIDNYAVTAFIQGNKTRRWALGWSFDHKRPSVRASRGSEPTVARKMLPFSTELTVFEGSFSDSDLERLKNTLCDTMEALDLVSWRWDVRLSRGVGFADGNVWGRAYRREKERRQKTSASLFSQSNEASARDVKMMIGPSTGETQHVIAGCGFGFAVSVQAGRSVHDTKDMVKLEARWLQGRDYLLFESFTGMLRKISLHSPTASSSEAVARPDSI